MIPATLRLLRGDIFVGLIKMYREWKARKEQAELEQLAIDAYDIRKTAWLELCERLDKKLLNTMIPFDEFREDYEKHPDLYTLDTYHVVCRVPVANEDPKEGDAKVIDLINYTYNHIRDNYGTKTLSKINEVLSSLIHCKRLLQEDVVPITSQLTFTWDDTVRYTVWRERMQRTAKLKKEQDHNQVNLERYRESIRNFDADITK